MLSQATGHQAKIEKRIGRANERRERESSPTLSERDVMVSIWGISACLLTQSLQILFSQGGGDDFQSFMQRRRQVCVPVAINT